MSRVQGLVAWGMMPPLPHIPSSCMLHPSIVPSNLPSSTPASEMGSLSPSKLRSIAEARVEEDQPGAQKRIISQYMQWTTRCVYIQVYIYIYTYVATCNNKLYTSTCVYKRHLSVRMFRLSWRSLNTLKTTIPNCPSQRIMRGGLGLEIFKIRFQTKGPAALTA